jgi:hypothetical protein
MSTKIKDSKLTVRITEEVSLNGRILGNTNKHEITGINEVSERILTVPTSQITILSASSGNGAGTFLSSSIKYVRLTNLDDTNFVRLSFLSASAPQGAADSNTSDFKLEANRTMIFTNTAFSGSSTNVDFSSFRQFTNLKGTADTSAVDIELFVATT